MGSPGSGVVPKRFVADPSSTEEQAASSFPKPWLHGRVLLSGKEMCRQEMLAIHRVLDCLMNQGS